MGIPRVRVHHPSKFVGWYAGAEVNGIAVEIACIDLRVVDLDDGPILGVSLCANTDIDRRGENDVSKNAALRSVPVSRNVLVEDIEPFDHLPRLVQLVRRSLFAGRLSFPTVTLILRFRYWMITTLSSISALIDSRYLLNATLPKSMTL